MYYAGHILAAYVGYPIIDIFQVDGTFIERIELNKHFEYAKLKAIQVDIICMPRLDWQEREFDTDQRKAKQLPRKILFAGCYHRPDSPQSKIYPFLVLYDRT